MASKTGNGPPSLSDVNTHARELVEKITAPRTAAAEAGAAPLGAALAQAPILPEFSRGTGALDEETGEPIVGRQAVALPEGDAGGTTDALADAKAEISGTAAPAAERDPATGRFVSEAAADVSQETPAAAAPTGEAAAETAAAALLERPDPMADYEEVEYEDPDLDKRFSVRVPKDAAAAVRNGYMRRADYSRKTMFLGDLRKTVEPLVGDGRLKAILPLIQRAMEDPEYGQFVVDAYNRRISGRPLTEAQAAAAQAGAVVAAAAAPAAPPVAPLTEGEDPFFADAMRPYNEKLDRALEAVNRMAETETQRVARETQARQQYEAKVNVGNQAHAALSSRYSDEFSGDPEKDMPAFMRAVQYGRASGLFDQYGESPASIVLAYEDLRREREAASASPAVAAVAAATERRVASANAAAVSTGTPAAAPVVKKVPPAAATRVNGVAADPKEFLRQTLARQAALAK